MEIKNTMPIVLLLISNGLLLCFLFCFIFWHLRKENIFDYRQIEGKVVEISRLQEIFADKVLEQVHIHIRVTKN